MHQIAQIYTYISKNFLGVTPPDIHYWGGIILLPRFLPLNERHRPTFRAFAAAGAITYTTVVLCIL